MLICFGFFVDFLWGCLEFFGFGLFCLGFFVMYLKHNFALPGCASANL